MEVFDSLIVADWPKGLYLAQQLSLEGKKTAYLYQRPVIKNPLGLFLSESSKTEKQFFNSLGILKKQEGGFCLLTQHGVWPLQKKKERDLIKSKSPLSSSFDKNFLFYLSHNLVAKVFEFNDLIFCEQSLDLFCDYFLFYPDFKKIQFFKKQHPNLSFFESIDWDFNFKSLNFPKKQDKKPLNLDFFINKNQQKSSQGLKFKDLSAKSSTLKDLSAKGSKLKDLFAKSSTLKDLSAKSSKFKDLFAKSYSLKDLSAHKIFFFKNQNPQSLPPYWQWQAFYYEVDFKDYKDTIPTHCVCIKNLLFPWCYDNLISLFHNNKRAEVWMKLRPEGDRSLWQKKAQQVLEDFFPGVSFKLIPKQTLKSFCIYGEESLQIPDGTSNKKIDVAGLTEFFQGDLGSEIKNEIRYFKTLNEQ